MAKRVIWGLSPDSGNWPRHAAARTPLRKEHRLTLPQAVHSALYVDDWYGLLSGGVIGYGDGLIIHDVPDRVYFSGKGIEFFADQVTQQVLGVAYYFS